MTPEIRNAYVEIFAYRTVTKAFETHTRTEVALGLARAQARNLSECDVVASFEKLLHEGMRLGTSDMSLSQLVEFCRGLYSYLKDENLIQGDEVDSCAEVTHNTTLKIIKEVADELAKRQGGTGE